MQTYREYATVPEHLFRGTFDQREEAWKQGLPIFVKDYDPPAVGSIVRALFNKIGLCRVVGYFAESSSATEPQYFFGLHVLPLDPPDWYVKQNGKGAKCHLFDPEFELVSLADAGAAQ